MLRDIITLKPGETYEITQGIEVIKQTIQQAHSIQVYDPPPSLLNELEPYLIDRNTEVYLPPKVKVSNKLKPYVVRTKNRLKAVYHGQTMVVGSIILPKIIFDITWRDDEIYDISALTVSKCLSCSHRSREHLKDNEDDVMLGSILPVPQAIIEIERHLRQSDWAFFTNIPPEVITGFMEILHGKEIKMILPHGVQIPPPLKSVKNKRIFPSLVKTSSRVHGREVQCGGICLPHIHFGIGWDKKEIISVRSLELSECVKCMHSAHKFGWHFCKRIW